MSQSTSYHVCCVEIKFCGRNVETLRVRKQCPPVTMEMTEEATNGQTDGQTDERTEKLACRECGTESRVRLLSCLHSYCADCIAHHAQDRESQLNYLENLEVDLI